MPGEYDDFDVAGAIASIGSDLFPAKSGPDSGDKNPILDGGDLGAPETPPSQSSQTSDSPSLTKEGGAPEPKIVPGQNSENPAPGAYTGAQMPKSWKKDMEPIWQKADPALHAYVAEREANVMRGIQQYKGGHDLWSSLVEPFVPLFQQHPDVNPIQLLQGLLQTHLTLVQATPEKKAELASVLLSQYGITINGQTAPDSALLTRLSRAEEQLAASERRWNSYENSQKQEVFNKNLSTVDAFLADPKNKYVEEVHNDILHLLRTGAAADLPSAYETACWANPVVRQKMLADQQSPTAKNGQPSRGTNGQFINLDSGDARPVKVKPGTIDNTIDGIVAKHYSKH